MYPCRCPKCYVGVITYNTECPNCQESKEAPTNFTLLNRALLVPTQCVAHIEPHVMAHYERIGTLFLARCVCIIVHYTNGCVSLFHKQPTTNSYEVFCNQVRAYMKRWYVKIISVHIYKREDLNKKDNKTLEEIESMLRKDLPEPTTIIQYPYQAASNFFFNRHFSHVEHLNLPLDTDYIITNYKTIPPLILKKIILCALYNLLANLPLCISVIQGHTGTMTSEKTLLTINDCSNPFFYFHDQEKIEGINLKPIKPTFNILKQHRHTLSQTAQTVKESRLSCEAFFDYPDTGTIETYFLIIKSWTDKCPGLKFLLNSILFGKNDADFDMNFENFKISILRGKNSDEITDFFDSFYPRIRTLLIILTQYQLLIEIYEELWERFSPPGS